MPPVQQTPGLVDGSQDAPVLGGLVPGARTAVPDGRVVPQGSKALDQRGLPPSRKQRPQQRYALILICPGPAQHPEWFHGPVQGQVFLLQQRVASSQAPGHQAGCSWSRPPEEQPGASLAPLQGNALLFEHQPRLGGWSRRCPEKANRPQVGPTRCFCGSRCVEGLKGRSRWRDGEGAPTGPHTPHLQGRASPPKVKMPQLRPKGALRESHSGRRCARAVQAWMPVDTRTRGHAGG